jgi:hypothetical protein
MMENRSTGAEPSPAGAANAERPAALRARATNDPLRGRATGTRHRAAASPSSSTPGSARSALRPDA